MKEDELDVVLQVKGLQRLGQPVTATPVRPGIAGGHQQHTKYVGAHREAVGVTRRGKTISTPTLNYLTLHNTPLGCRQHDVTRETPSGRRF